MIRPASLASHREHEGETLSHEIMLHSRYSADYPKVIIHPLDTTKAAQAELFVTTWHSSLYRVSIGERSEDVPLESALTHVPRFDRLDDPLLPCEEVPQQHHTTAFWRASLSQIASVLISVDSPFPKILRQVHVNFKHIADLAA